MHRLRVGFVLVALALALGAANWLIADKQTILQYGTAIYLPLGTRDPRSLIQGDYMTLRYDARVFPPADVLFAAPDRGTVVLGPDAETGRHRFLRLDDGGALAPGEVRLRYRLRGPSREVHYGAESFFFQAGRTERYAGARFGVLRVDEAGNSVLAGLADEERTMIRP